MKNSATSDNLILDLKKSKPRKKCLSPQNNACSYLQETEIENNDVFLGDFQDKIEKSKKDKNQEKICSECIWGKNY